MRCVQPLQCMHSSGPAPSNKTKQLGATMLMWWGSALVRIVFVRKITLVGSCKSSFLRQTSQPNGLHVFGLLRDSLRLYIITHNKSMIWTKMDKFLLKIEDIWHTNHWNREHFSQFLNDRSFFVSRKENVLNFRWKFGLSLRSKMKSWIRRLSQPLNFGYLRLL